MGPQLAQLPWMKRKTLPPSSTIPPTQQHPAKHLVVRTSAAGLIVHPYEGDKELFRGAAVLCTWGRNGKVEALEEWVEEAGGEESIVIEGGVAGLLRGFQDTFLILITGTKTIASLFDASKPISRVETTLSVPLDRLAARTLLAKYALQKGQVSGHRSTHSVSTEGADSGDDETETDTDGELLADSEGLGEDKEADSVPVQAGGAKDPLATIRGSLNRPFWRRSPFSPQAATPTSPTSPTPPTPPPATSAAAIGTSIIPEATFNSTASLDGDLVAIASRKELDEKVVKECMRQLNGMYFSNAIDITHSLQHKYEAAPAPLSSSLSPNTSKDPNSPASPRGGLVEPASYLPLWRRASKRFWWNAHLMAPFVEAGLHSYVTVLQQGFIQQTTLSLPLQSYTTLSTPSSADPATPTHVSLSLLVISRRSVERPGLRYQRRGINVNGGVANFVESEFIVCVERDGKKHVSSLVQTRGSIPVFWSQSPWSLKPPPVLERTSAESLAALTRHFEKQIKLYGNQIVVNLAETSGKEAVVVQAYREGVQALGEDKVKYVEFDFHAECRGMKYENISKLTDSLTQDLEETRCFWATDDQVFSTQAGVVRTNCIDCLDRTNVVQSAISRWVVNRHLVHLGITTQEEVGMHDELDQRFNEIWADNGDAISREYAGTSALKGDFTRTGKRNWRGAVNDASNSVARLLQSTVTDFFNQAVIDYVLGHNLAAFAEFQDRLDVSDPGEILRLYQIRQEAVETSTASVLSEGEDKLAGWTLLSPAEPDVVRSRKYEEKVLLLSTKALYVVSYEFTLQKVVSFTRIPSGDIASIQKGAYILSALGTGCDVSENYGFIIRYHAGAALSRINTYSMRVKAPSSPSRGASTTSSSASSTNSASDIHFFAFKALRKDAIQLASAGHSQILSRRQEDTKGTAADTVAEIVGRLREECEKVGAVKEGDEDWIVEKDIVSVAEAQAQTGLLDKLQYGLKSLIWL